MSISGIARELGIRRNTVKRHLKIQKPMEYSRRKRKSKLDPVKSIIDMLIEKHNLSAVRILEEVREWGYRWFLLPPQGILQNDREVEVNKGCIQV